MPDALRVFGQIGAAGQVVVSSLGLTEFRAGDRTAAAPGGDRILLETGDVLLLETGDKVLKE